MEGGLLARIRTIKPEFCTSDQIVECSTNARLLFVQMWMFCDDNGVHPANAKRLKMECFPADPFTETQMKAMVQELLDNGLLREYTVQNERFWIVTGWEKHQKIDRPNPKFPLPLDDDSTNDRRAIDEPSPPEGKGVEGKGKDGRYIGEADAPPTPLADPPLPQKAKKQDPLDLHVAGCVTRLNEVAGRRYEPTSAACKHLRARLRSVPVAERESVARQACLIAEFKASQWLGDPKMRNYLRPETLWGAEHWDTYGQEAADWDEAGRPPPLAKNGKPIEPTRRQMIEEALKDL